MSRERERLTSPRVVRVAVTDVDKLVRGVGHHQIEATVLLRLEQLKQILVRALFTCTTTTADGDTSPLCSNASSIILGCKFV